MEKIKLLKEALRDIHLMLEQGEDIEQNLENNVDNGIANTDNKVEDIDFSQFQIQDTLCPKIFNLETKMMLPEIREKLLEISFAFYEYIEIEPIKYSDVILTGSLASYNWSDFSDLDLHVVIPFSDVTDNVDIVENMLWALKSKFNQDHEIVVNDFKVELFAQDEHAPSLVSNGIYSIQNDKWIKFPKKIKYFNINKDRIYRLINHFNERYADILKLSQNIKPGDNLENILSLLDSLSDDIFKMRKKGLNSPAGEFSSYNLAYKILRRGNMLNNIRKLSDDIFDTKYSIKTFSLDQDVSGLSKDYQDKLEKIKNKKIQIAKAQYGGEGDIEAAWGNRPYYGSSGELGADVKKSAGRYSVKGPAKYSIEGKKFVTLRQAAATLNVPKSTIEYRLKSNKPEWSNWRYINK